MQAFLGPTQLYKYKAQIVGRNRFRESNLLARRTRKIKPVLLRRVVGCHRKL